MDQGLIISCNISSHEASCTGVAKINMEMVNKSITNSNKCSLFYCLQQKQTNRNKSISNIVLQLLHTHLKVYFSDGYGKFLNI